MSHPTGARLLPLAFLLVLAGCAPHAPDTAADSAALLSTAEGFTKAYNDKNADAISALYTEDAQLLPPARKAVQGRTSIHEFFANSIQNYWAKMTINVESSGVSGDWGWRSGTWSVETTPAVTGKFLDLWRRTPDGWRMHRDIWNLDAPSSPPAAPAAPSVG